MLNQRRIKAAGAPCGFFVGLCAAAQKIDSKEGLYQRTEKHPDRRPMPPIRFMAILCPEDSNIMLDWNIKQQQNWQHQRDLLRDAAHERLVRQVQSANGKPSTLYGMVQERWVRPWIPVGERSKGGCEQPANLQLDIPNK